MASSSMPASIDLDNGQQTVGPRSPIATVRTMDRLPAKAFSSAHKTQKDIRDYFQPKTNEISPMPPSLSHSSPTVREEVPLSHLRYELAPRHDSRETALASIRGTGRATAVLKSSRPSTVIDLSLMPKPLRLNTNVRRSPSDDLIACPPTIEDDCVLMSAAIDTQGSFRRSRILSIFEKQSLGMDQSFSREFLEPVLMNRLCSPKEVDALTAGQQPKSSESEDTVIYFLPSPSPTSRLPIIKSPNRRPSDPSTSQQGLLKRWHSIDEAAYNMSQKQNKAQSVRGNGDYVDYIGAVANGRSFRNFLFHLKRVRLIVESEPLESPRVYAPRRQNKSTQNDPYPQQLVPAYEAQCPQHRRTQSESAASGDRGKKKTTAGRMVRLMQKYARHVEGLQMIQ